jgi:hypothetical protein
MVEAIDMYKYSQQVEIPIFVLWTSGYDTVQSSRK